MEILKMVKDGNVEVSNHIKVEGGVYTHKQIEKINGKVFMRMKSRKLGNISSTL